MCILFSVFWCYNVNINNYIQKWGLYNEKIFINDFSVDIYCYNTNECDGNRR